MTRFAPRPKRLPALLGFGLAWVLLNLFLTIDFPLPSAFTLKPLLPSLDVWGLLLVLCFLAWRRVPFTARVYLPLIGLLVFGRLFRLGDVVMPVYFNRPFNLYMDVGYLPGLGHLLANSFAPLELALYGAVAAGLVAALLWLLWRGLRTAHVFFPGCGRAARVYGLDDRHGASGGRPPERPLAPGAGSAGRLHGAAGGGGGRFYPQYPRNPAAGAFRRADGRSRHPGLPGPPGRAERPQCLSLPDRVLRPDPVRNPAHRKQFAPTLARFEAELNRGGYAVCSRYMRSPTFGGASWLAFGTLESGVWLPNQLRYGYLVASRVPPLASYFEKAGYRTVSVMPGTTMPWPEGRYFGYRKAYQARDLDYRGPAFGFAPMPDQFVLDRIYRTEILPAARPRSLSATCS
jgi:hypothetical protein